MKKNFFLEQSKMKTFIQQTLSKGICKNIIQAEGSWSQTQNEIISK